MSEDRDATMDDVLKERNDALQVIRDQDAALKERDRRIEQLQLENDHFRLRLEAADERIEQQREDLEACHQRIGEINSIIMERDKEIAQMRQDLDVAVGNLAGCRKRSEQLAARLGERLRDDKLVLLYQLDDERNENGLLREDRDQLLAGSRGMHKDLEQTRERLDEQLKYNAALVEENAELKARVADREATVGRLAN